MMGRGGGWRFGDAGGGREGGRVVRRLMGERRSKSWCAEHNRQTPAEKNDDPKEGH